MPLPWLLMPLVVYVLAGAVAGFVFAALTLIHRLRFGPLPRPVIVLPEREPAPEPASAIAEEGVASEIPLADDALVAMESEA